jgi:CheY-like chemotaxis protein
MMNKRDSSIDRQLRALTEGDSPLTAAGEPAPRRALLMDDDDANRMLLSAAMQLGGLDFDEAPGGTAALAIWQPGAYVYCFLDIEMPDMSGLEVARRMRAQDAEVVLIMCSANDDPDVLAEALAADCDIFFVKPFQIDALLSVVRVTDPRRLRHSPRVLVVDNAQRPRWEPRGGPSPTAVSPA